MIRGKIICRHKPVFCWKTKFVEQYPGIQIFVYPVEGSVGNSPTVYESIFILQVPEDEYKQDLDRVVEECIDNAPLTKGEFRKIEDVKIKEQQLVLPIYKFKAIHEDKESSRSASLLFAIYDQESQPYEPEKMSWIHVQNVKGNGLEVIFPRYSSGSTYKQNVEGIKSIRTKNKKPFEIKFPNTRVHYGKDYMKDYFDYKEPVEYLLPKGVKKRILMEIKNQVVPKNKIMEKLQKYGTKAGPVIKVIWALLTGHKPEK